MERLKAWIGIMGLILVVAEGTSFAEGVSRNPLLDFQVNSIAAFQNGISGNSFSGQLGWSPRFELNESLGVRGLVAASLMKGSLNNFVAAEAQALASYGLGSSLQVEAGGGFQSWIGQGVNSPMASGQAAWKLASPMFGLVDRFFAGYSYLFATNAQAQEVKLGIGINL